MVRREYVPERGDLVWTDFSPQRGHEQMGRRPALILSSRDFTKHTGFMLCCPATSQEKGYPFEVPFVAQAMRGVVLADQAHSFDWRARHVVRAGKVPEAVVEKRTVKKRLKRRCSYCGAPLHITIFTDKHYRGGEYFGKLAISNKKEWEKAHAAGTHPGKFGSMTIQVMNKDPKPYKYAEMWECTACYRKAGGIAKNAHSV